MDSSAAAILGVVAGATMTILVLGIVFYVLLVIALWKIYNKFGEPGWKAIIPIYNVYILFKYCWNTKMFWISLILLILGYGIMGAGSDGGALYTVGSILALVGCIIMLICEYYQSKAFGHGVGFFILMIIFPNIMTLYLGFSKDQYVGNPSLK